jgi:hypothetical protein
MEEFDEFGPGVLSVDSPAPVTGGAFMGYPDPAEVMRDAARHLTLIDGQVVTLPDGSAVFRAGHLPGFLQFCADRLDAERQVAADHRRQEREARQRRLDRVRIPAALAFSLCNILGRVGDWPARAAYRLDRAYGFTDNDDY